jgi:serine/threonine-protein kinase RsbT
MAPAPPISTAVHVRSSQEMAIQSEDDVLLVRREVRMLADRLGFNPFATAAITTATSELARNIWSHAGGGAIRIEVLDEDGRSGLRLVFSDEGPGIPDIERVLVGGYSTARSLGLGLSGSRRLVDDFELQSQPGRGTVVTIVKWGRV